MEKEILNMVKEVVPKLGNDAIWVFAVIYGVSLLKSVIWGGVIAAFPYFFFKTINKAKERRWGEGKEG